jgi:hypothetical protein
MRWQYVVTVAVGLVAAAGSAHAFGFGGSGSQMGDSWLNDQQKNPRFIEPGAQYDPSRYRASNPYEGWKDRQRAYRGDARAPYGYRDGY